MTSEQFSYWLQGFAEITDKAPSEKEWKIIKDHLSTVFNKITPDRSPKMNEPLVAPFKTPHSFPPDIPTIYC